MLWVPRAKGGKRQALALAGPAAARVDAYLASRADLEALPALPAEAGQPRPRRVLFATDTGGRMFAADVWHLVRRLAAQAKLPADWWRTSDRTRCGTASRPCTSMAAGTCATSRTPWATPTRGPRVGTTGPGTSRSSTWPSLSRTGRRLSSSLHTKPGFQVRNRGLEADLIAAPGSVPPGTPSRAYHWPTGDRRAQRLRGRAR